MNKVLAWGTKVFVRTRAVELRVVHRGQVAEKKAVRFDRGSKEQEEGGRAERLYSGNRRQRASNHMKKTSRFSSLFNCRGTEQGQERKGSQKEKRRLSSERATEKGRRLGKQQRSINMQL